MCLNGVQALLLSATCFDTETEAREINELLGLMVGIVKLKYLMEENFIS